MTQWHSMHSSPEKTGYYWVYEKGYFTSSDDKIVKRYFVTPGCNWYCNEKCNSPYTPESLVEECGNKYPEVWKEISQDRKWGKSHWDDHPDYSSEDWREEAANNDTRLGYVDWVNNQIGMNKDD